MKPYILGAIGLLLLSIPALAQTTPNLSLNIPTAGSNVGIWGPLINSNFSTLDLLLSGNSALTGLNLVTPKIGGETITASPRMTFTCYKAAASGNAATADCVWTPDKAVTVTRFQIGNVTAPTGCSTVPQFGVVLISGPTTVVALNLPNGSVNADTGAVSVNLSAGTAYQIGQTQADAGCGSHAGAGNMTLQYKMQ